MNLIYKPRIWKNGDYWHCQTLIFVWLNSHRAIDYAQLDLPGAGVTPELAYHHWFKLNHAFN